LKVVQNDTVQLSVVKRYRYYDSLKAGNMSEVSWSVTPSGAVIVDGQGRLIALQSVDSGKLIFWLTADATVRDTVNLTVWPVTNAYTLTPTDDAILDYYDKTKKFGSISSITIKSNPVRNPLNTGFDIKRGMFQFDLSAIPKNRTILRADFSLSVLEHGFTTVNFPMSVVNTDNNWDESTVSWNSRSTAFAISGKCDWNCDVDAANLFVLPQNTRQHWDLTTYIQSKIVQDTLSFFLYKYKVSDMWVKFASRDTSAALQPRLRIILGGTPQVVEGSLSDMSAPALSVYPNPFNPTTRIIVRHVSRDCRNFSLKLFDLQGRLVKDLTSSVAWHGNGGGVAYWHPASYSSGVYAIQMQVEKHVWQSKVIMQK
ncbi:MAG: T9SS type A sorting domain-containing protein, partial [Fibrobacteres bacterium]|nr:T9SS type A sorting domain-containing protein [Fibrobacterota bacterium]